MCACVCERERVMSCFVYFEDVVNCQSDSNTKLISDTMEMKLDLKYGCGWLD